MDLARFDFCFRARGFLLAEFVHDLGPAAAPDNPGFVGTHLGRRVLQSPVSIVRDHFGYWGNYIGCRRLNIRVRRQRADGSLDPAKLAGKWRSENGRAAGGGADADTLEQAGPSQLWSWDITCLAGTVAGLFVYLYLI